MFEVVVRMADIKLNIARFRLIGLGFQICSISNMVAVAVLTEYFYIHRELINTTPGSLL